MGVKHINWLHLEIQLKSKSLTNNYTNETELPGVREVFLCTPDMAYREKEPAMQNYVPGSVCFLRSVIRLTSFRRRGKAGWAIPWS